MANITLSFHELEKLVEKYKHKEKILKNVSVDKENKKIKFFNILPINNFTAKLGSFIVNKLFSNDLNIKINKIEIENHIKIDLDVI